MRGSRSLDFGGKGCKVFGPDGHTFDRRWIFLYREGDNNYSISMAIFCYNPKLCCFVAKSTKAATGGVL